MPATLWLAFIANRSGRTRRVCVDLPILSLLLKSLIICKTPSLDLHLHTILVFFSLQFIPIAKNPHYVIDRLPLGRSSKHPRL